MQDTIQKPIANCITFRKRGILNNIAIYQPKKKDGVRIKYGACLVSQFIEEFLINYRVILKSDCNQVVL